MINLISDKWSDFKDWKENTLERSEGPWVYYTQERAVPQGLPIAIISAVAANYLFQCTTASNAAIFATVNYITLTTLAEILRINHTIEKEGAAVLSVLSAAISFAFIYTVCKTSFTYQTAIQTTIVLGIAAFAGQLSRELV